MTGAKRGDDRPSLLSAVHDPNNRFPSDVRTVLNYCAHTVCATQSNRGSNLVAQKEDEAIMYDGELLPIDAIAVRPYWEEDLAKLVAHVPVCLALELARMAAWRSLRLAGPMPTSFKVG